MNQQDLVTFNLAVTQAQAGQKEAAYDQLKALLKNGNGNHRDPNLLLWLAFTSPDLEESKTALEMAASIDPNNAGLPAARDWLTREQRRKEGERFAEVRPTPVSIAAPPLPNFSQPQPQTQQFQPTQMPVQPQYNPHPSQFQPQWNSAPQVQTVPMYSAPQQPIVLPRKRLRTRDLVIAGTAIFLLVVLGAVYGLQFFRNNETAIGQINETYYSSPQELIYNAKPGEYARFQGQASTIADLPGDSTYNYGVWWSDFYLRAYRINLRFPNSKGLRPIPFSPNAIYHIRISSILNNSAEAEVISIDVR